MSQNFFSTTSQIGVDLNNASATALFAVGTHVLGQYNTEWVYVQANTSIVANTIVAFNSGTFTCGMASGGDLTSGSQLATAQTSISSQAFGWVAVRGVGLTVQTTGSTTATAQGIFLAASGTPTGSLSNVASASNTVQGISFLAAASGTYTVCSLSWPKGAAAGE